MKFYSIVDVVYFLKHQKIFNYKAVDIILDIFDSKNKDLDEKLSEIHYVLMECGMDGFLSVNEDEDGNAEKAYMVEDQIILDEIADDIYDIEKGLPIYKFQAAFINGRMLFICWIN